MSLQYGVAYVAKDAGMLVTLSSNGVRAEDVYMAVCPGVDVIDARGRVRQALPDLECHIEGVGSEGKVVPYVTSPSQLHRLLSHIRGGRGKAQNTAEAKRTFLRQHTPLLLQLAAFHEARRTGRSYI